MMDIYCLPYSGASATVYYQWQRKVPEWLRICPVELPGRGMRMDEVLQTDPEVLVARLAAAIERGFDGRPYAVFGHSLGAILAFELVHRFIALGMPAPSALFASGTSAPTRRERCIEELARLQSDADLLAHLRELGGTSEAVMANEELISLTLPVIRADFKLCENYVYKPRPRLSCPLIVMGGNQDDVSGEELQAWRNEAGAGFHLMMFEGGHFFIHQSQAVVLESITSLLGANGAPMPPHRINHYATIA